MTRPSRRVLPAPAAWGPGVLVALAYVAVIVLFTWPLVTTLGSRFVLERGSDLWQHVWNFGWVRTALLDLHQSPYYTYSIFYPTGVPLVYHALNLFSAIVSLPLQLTLGLIPAFNLLLLGNLVAAALAAYWLARVLGLGRGPAFLAGLLYACSPPLSSSFNHGQGELVSVFWIPLFVGLLIRGGGLRALGLPPGPRGYLVAAGAALVGSVLAIYYWTVTLAIFFGLYLLVELIAWARAAGGAALRRWWARLLWLVGTAAVLAVPIGVLLLRAQLRSSVGLGIAGGTSDAVIALSSVDLGAFFLPGPSHVDPAQILWQGANLGLGWTPLLLAIAGLVWTRGPRRRSLLFWALAALVFGALALGPSLLLAGQDTSIPLPYAVILQIPGAAAMRVPLRFLTPLALCLAILAASGLATLRARLPRRAAGAALLAVALLLVGAEFFNIPRPLVDPAVAPIYAQLAAAPSPCDGVLREPLSRCDAVLELPLQEWTAPAMFHQALDHHPMIGGYTSRHFPDPFQLDAPGVSQLIAAAPEELGPDIVNPPLEQTAVQAMDYYGVRYVLVHPLTAYPAADKLRAVLGLLFPGGGTASGDVQVYTVPHVAQDRAFLYLGSGWYDQEHTPEGVRFRWADQQATVPIVVPAPAAGTYTLTAAVFSIADTRTLVARLDGQEVGRYPVTLPPGGTVTIPLTLAPGAHTLTLASVEPAVTPPQDPRTLSLGYRSLTLARSP